jgi:hypothetical protein
VKYSLRLATKEDLAENLRSARLESQQSVCELIKRKLFFTNLVFTIAMLAAQVIVVGCGTGSGQYFPKKRVPRGGASEIKTVSALWVGYVYGAFGGKGGYHR